MALTWRMIAVMERIDDTRAQPLHDAEGSRLLEHRALQSQPPHALMAAAGRAVARLALAVAPGARRHVVLVGPGNNGGDGLVAARLLHQAGQPVLAILAQDTFRPGSDAQWAWEQARQAGVPICLTPTDLAPPRSDELLIDALLGLGADRPPDGRVLALLRHGLAHPGPRLAVDLPTGLNPDTGQSWGSRDDILAADHTLSLLTLKPGLFMGRGRDVAGRIWLERLGISPTQPSSCLSGLDELRRLWQPAAHDSHKGSRGDVAVLGGAAGMEGAAELAALAALHAGAGRVYVAALGARRRPPSPALMTRPPGALDWENLTLVCGCGGGQALLPWLARALALSHRLVLDADALNLLSRDATLRAQMRQRAASVPTLLTPHPLEAARLLGTTVADVQADRLRTARQLAADSGAVVLLKGSGSVTADPGGRTWVNPTGDARLATAGTGDVLAGLCGALLARGLDTAAAARLAAYWHGAAAAAGPQGADVCPAHVLVEQVRGTAARWLPGA